MSSAHYQRRQVNINPVTNSLIYLGDLLIRQANIRVTTKSVELTNQYLSGFKAYSMIIPPSLPTLHVINILGQNNPVFRRKPNPTVLLKKCTTRKWLLLAFWKIYKSVSHSVIIIEVSSCRRQNSYRNSDLVDKQRVRDLKTLSTKWDVSINSLPSELRKLWKRSRKLVRVRGEWRIPKKHCPLNPTGLTHIQTHRNFGSMNRTYIGLCLKGYQSLKGK